MDECCTDNSRKMRKTITDAQSRKGECMPHQYSTSRGRVTSSSDASAAENVHFSSDTEIAHAQQDPENA